jgi:hypothetical protein
MSTRRFASCAAIRATVALFALPLVVIAWLPYRAASGRPPGETSVRERTVPSRPVHQLRIYEIFEHNQAAFHARFRDHAVRIMQRHGFDIVSMWESRSTERTEFVYLLQWPDSTTMVNRWESFMADAEWSAIKAKSAAAHGQLVGDIQSRVLRTTEYSPPLPSRRPSQ